MLFYPYATAGRSSMLAVSQRRFAMLQTGSGVTNRQIRRSGFVVDAPCNTKPAVLPGRSPGSAAAATGDVDLCALQFALKLGNGHGDIVRIQRHAILAIAPDQVG